MATLVGQLRDLELAEDVLQEALISALKTWPTSGIPDAPRAWLITVARNRAVDHLRRVKSFSQKSKTLKLLEEERRGAPAGGLEKDENDERLQLIFLCCHPSLAFEAQVALTLKTLGGLSVDEIARGFLVTEVTMAQRLVRAKRKIRGAKIPFRIPDAMQIEGRLTAVMKVLYLIFNEGYAARSGTRVTRADLCVEAIRLSRILVALAPNSGEAKGLLALMLLHDARRNARTDRSGAMVALEDQNRTLWDREQIVLGDRFLREALASGPAGPYQLQAAISAVHAAAADFASTDWPQLTGLYDALYAIAPSPVVSLNAAWAVSMSRSVEEALELVEKLEEGGNLDRYQPLYATKADLLNRAGRSEEAIVAFRVAIALSENEAEREFLRGRMERLSC